MDYLEQVQRGVDFIEDHLDSDLGLGEVAKHAGISQWHFQRIFKALTNETLKTYIRSRRLANALDKLLTTKTRIIEIALSAGYESQESFTRAFKKTFDMTPDAYRRLGHKSLFLKKARFDLDYLRHLHEGVSLEPELYQQPRLRLVGLRTCFYSVDSEKNNIGEKLPGLWEAFVPRLAEIAHAVPGVCYGVVQPTPEQTDLLEYHAAIAVTEVGPLPPGMTLVEVPAASYAKFAHKGLAREVNHTVNYVYSTWLLGSGYRHTYGPDLEIYGSAYHPTSSESLIHYAIPIA